jgi:endonuclease/exonuclease/phosphatase (EEP) superfamily protein YafD
VPVPLSIVQANLWRENPSKPEDVALLVSTKADLLNVNEARLFEPLLKQVPGYQTFQPGTGFMLNNAILVRDGIKVTGFEARQMCDPVNDVAARSATLVKFEFAGKQRAHLCTHMNAHIQLTQNEPQSLPRVKEAIRHAIRLEAWVKELRAQGLLVTVAGDFNWSWNVDDKNDWTYSPEAITTRLGMTTSSDEPTRVGPTLGNRAIDYIWFDPKDLRVAAQEYVRGEHSDHSWVMVDFVTG